MTRETDPIRRPEFPVIDQAELDALIARAHRLRAEAVRDSARFVARAVRRAPGAVAALVRSAFARAGRA